MAATISFEWGVTASPSAASADVDLSTLAVGYGNGNSVNGLVPDSLNAFNITLPYWGDGVTTGLPSAGTRVYTRTFLGSGYLRATAAQRYVTLFIGAYDTLVLNEEVHLTFSTDATTFYTPTTTTTPSTQGGYTVNILGNAVVVSVSNVATATNNVVWMQFDRGNGNTLNRVNITDAGGVDPKFGVQALAFGSNVSGPPPNCFAGSVQLATPTGWRRVDELKSGNVVTAVNADGEESQIPVAVVRFRPILRAKMVRVADEVLVSPSHVVMLPSGSDHTQPCLKPAAEWACGTCRAAGKYGAGGCQRCTPLRVAGHTTAAACDLSNGEVVEKPMLPVFHVVPLDFDKDVHKAVKLQHGVLSEMFRTPIDVVLATHGDKVTEQVEGLREQTRA